MNSSPSGAQTSNYASIASTALVVVLLSAIYGEIVGDLCRSWWKTPEQSQGLLITPFALFMVWIHRQAILEIPAGQDLRGLWLLAAGCAMHLAGHLVAGLYVSQLSLVVVLAGLVGTFWGFGRLRLLFLPLLLLVTAIPLPGVLYGTLSRPLQLFTSRVACAIADLAGVTVYREGNIIHLASISLGVWEACNGLTSLSALIVGSALLGFTLCRKPVLRLAVFLAAVPVAISANIARVSVTAILSDWRPAFALGFYHAFSGWLVFLAGVSSLYAIAWSLRERFEK